LTRAAIAQASAAPTVAPIAPINTPSTVNCDRIPARRTPRARIVPTSLVRSITFMVMVLITANSTITPITIAMKRKIELNICTTCT
jgi:hypothetical protein